MCCGEYITTDFNDFCEINADTVFRYWIYRRMYTPFEKEKKYSDETWYEDSFCTFAHIGNVIALPDGDYLIEFLVVDEDMNYWGRKQYCKLSEIRLEQFDCDNEPEEIEDNVEENGKE